MAIKQTVGQVTPEERDEIQRLFERRNGLNELSKIVTADNDELYEKLVKDLGKLVRIFKTGGTEWPQSMNGEARMADTGKSISILVKSF